MVNPTQAALQAIVDAGGYVQVGGILYGPAPYGITKAPVQGTIDAYYAANAAAVLGNPLGTIQGGAKVPVLGAATAAAMNTTVTNAMGADGLTWANAPSIQDAHGNIIVITEDSSTNHHFTYLNASGGTWADGSLSEAFLTRGAMWLDTVHGLLHVLWVATQANAGALYRRYSVSYTGNDITDIVSDSTLGTRTNLVMDDGTGLASEVEHPILIPLPDIGGTYGALLAIWGVTSAAGGELRASMIVMGSTATQGQTAGNWAAPVSADTTTLGANTQPAVAYSRLGTGTNTAHVPYVGAARYANGTHAKDIFFTYWDGTAYKFRRMQWNSGASNWSTGITVATTIYNVARAGSDTGYGFKWQLISAPSEDANGNMFVGLASWKDNANGDTWGFAKIDGSGTVTTVDVFSWAGSSASGTPSLYNTGDVMVDPVNGYIVASYITQTDAKVQLYTTALATSGAAVQVFNVVSDIPLLLRARVAGGTKLGVLERDAVNTPTPPYHGRYATLTWQ